MSQMYGLGIEIRNWKGNWLHNRKTRVVVNGAKYKLLLVTSGVPQGFVLGPIVSIIYINYIDVNVSSSVLMLADDTILHSYVFSCDRTGRLQYDLDKMSEWSTMWQMLFNADKFIGLHVGHS